MAIIIRFENSTKISVLCSECREVENKIRKKLGIDSEDELLNFAVHCDDCEAEGVDRNNPCATCTIYVWCEDGDIVSYLYNAANRDHKAFIDKLECLKEMLIEIALHPNVRFVVLTYGLAFEPYTILGVASREKNGITDVIMKSMARMAYLIDASQLLILLMSREIEKDIEEEVNKRLEEAYGSGKSLDGLCVGRFDNLWLLWPCESRIFEAIVAPKGAREGVSTISPFAKFALSLVRNILEKYKEMYSG